MSIIYCLLCINRSVIPHDHSKGKEKCEEDEVVIEEIVDDFDLSDDDDVIEWLLESIFHIGWI